MSNFDDKTQTFKFDPILEEKPQQNRVSDDEFSAARRGKNYENYRRKEEKGNGALVAIAIILAVLLIGAIVAGIFILKGDKEPQNPLDEVIIEKEPEEEEEPPEVQNVSLSCNIVFYPESVIAKDGGYTILADLYDDGMYKFDNKKLIINGETDIRQDGKRLTPRALIYIIENSGGDMPVFEGEIREEDGSVISLSFEAPAEEEIPEELPEGELPEGENPEEPLTEDITIGEVTEE